MIIVYLDQNKWIDLARAYHGRDIRPPLQRALEFIAKTGKAGTHAYPLSAVHYMETNKSRDIERRDRLGEAMWELSGGRTIATHRELLVHEIELALSVFFPRVVPSTFQFLGRGVAHAFGRPELQLSIPEDARQQTSSELLAELEELLRQSFEKSCITGVGPEGMIMPPSPTTTHSVSFMKHLDELPQQFGQLPRDRWEDLLHAFSMLDIREPLAATLMKHGLEPEALGRLGKEGVTAFVDSIPTRRLDMHLHRQVLRNPALRPRETDLQDWAGLGPAAAHCDIVVCEKHFADMLLRDRFEPKATVLTDVTALPDVST